MSDELPPRLAALISGERDAPTGDRRRVRAQLSASLGIAAAGSAAAASTIATKLVILAVAVGGGAALVAHRVDPAKPAPVTVAPARIAVAAPDPVVAPVTPDPVVAPAAATAASPPVIVARPPPPVPARAVAIATPVPAEAPAPDVATAVVEPPVAPAPADPAPFVAPTPDQHALLALAWSALSRGDNRAALALLDQDASHHPNATLDEERDALRVEVLRRLGQTTSASQAARAFLARFPASVHRALVAQALAKESP